VSSTPGQCPSNNPVELSLGAKVHSDTDVAGNGRAGSLSLSRTYNSFGHFNPTAVGLTGYESPVPMSRGGMFGTRWRSNYDRRLFPVSQTITSPWWTLPSQALASIQREDGSVQHFRLDGMEALPKPGRVPGRLTKLFATCPTDQSQVCYEYRSGNDEVERYSGGGLLLEIAHKTSGQAAQHLAYDAQYRLSTVTDETGRVLTFAYAGFRVSSATLPDGKVITYSYDSKDRLASVGYPVESGQPAAVRHYHYEDARTGFQTFLTGITDENGARFTTIAYNADGRVESTVRAPQQGGGINRFTYTYSFANPAYPTTTYTDPLGGSTTVTSEYWHDSIRFKTQSQPCPNCGVANVSSRTYDPSNGYLDKETDFRGVVTDYATDTLGRTTQRIEVANSTCPADLPNCQAARRTTQTVWADAYNEPVERRVLDASGQVEQLTRSVLNARGQLVARCEVDPNNSTAVAYACGTATHAPAGVRQTRRAYCEAADIAPPASTCPVLGLPKSIDGPRIDVSDVVSYTYHATTDESGCDTGGPCQRKGDLAVVTNALGHTTEYLRYDRAGRVAQIRDANGVVTDLEYHPRGWLSARKVRGADPGSETDDAITRIEYDATGSVTRVTQPDGAYLAYTYDDARRLTDITDNAGNAIHYTLDAAGNRIKEETRDPVGTVRRLMARQFDQLGRLKALVNAPYASQPNLDDPSVKKTVTTYDANGNTETVTDPLGTVVDSDYDPINRLIRTIQDLGGIGAEVEYQYDARDNLAAVNDPKNLDTTYSYDGLNNLTQLVSPDTGTTTYTYDAAGNRANQTDARGVTSTYAYDALNRLISITYPTSSLNVAFEYDGTQVGCELANGRLTRMTDASGETKFCYDRRGNLVKKTQTTGGITFTTEWTYDLADRVDTILYPSGTLLQYVRDDGRVTAITVLDSASGPFGLIDGVEYLPFGPVSGITFANGRAIARGYDQNYWIESIITPVDSVSLSFEPDDLGNIVDITTSGASSVTRHYAYDDLSRLTDVTPGAGSPIESSTYDATGNRLSKAVGGPATTYTYPTTSHRLTAVGSAGRNYDANGNYTATGPLGPLEAVYDNRNRLAKWRLS
jgi:YD repeat-containing protein